jgi:general secretion pathway protein F
MLGAGVPMLRVLDTAKEILGNTVLIEAVEKARQAVTEGESLAVTLQKTGYFPPTVIHMVAVGERAGALESMLIRVADAYDREVELELNRFTAFLGPMLLLIMAGGVAFMVFAILEPLLGMQQFAY